MVTDRSLVGSERSTPFTYAYNRRTPTNHGTLSGSQTKGVTTLGPLLGLNGPGVPVDADPFRATRILKTRTVRRKGGGIRIESRNSRVSLIELRFDDREAPLPM